MSTSLSFLLDEVTPLLERVKTFAQAQGIALVAARAVGGLVKDHLYGLDAQRHRYGDHFYRQAGDSVTALADQRGAIVSVTQLGFRLRFFGTSGLPGGALRPKNGTYLTIPAAPEAYGHRAREFNDLDFAIVENPDTGSLQPALVRRAQTVIKHRRVKTKEGVTFKATAVMSLLPAVMYWLTRSVTQAADPTVLPYSELMQARALEAARARLLRLATRGQLQNPENN